MIVLHALWTKSTLHVWAEDADAPEPPPRDTASSTPEIDPTPAADDADTTPPPLAQAATHDRIRDVVGGVFDSLLASEAKTSKLNLRLPHRNATYVSSVDEAQTTPAREEPGALRLSTRRVPTLAFAPADAVDLLTTTPATTREEVRLGASLGYWTRMAALVMELLAKQRFVPALHHAGGDRYSGYWHAVVNEDATATRLNRLIDSMPPVCRAFDVDEEPVQASALVENFLWTSVDALVRRCLEGDELAHAILDRRDGDAAPQMRWLRSVVSSDSHLEGTPEERRATYDAVRGWVSRLEPLALDRAFRTCFQLHTPHPTASSTMSQRAAAAEDSQAEAANMWRLTVHVQSTAEPHYIMDASKLFDRHRRDPLILRRPFDNAGQQLRADLSKAALHFPPLAPCAQTDGPLECTLTIDQAYAFLRDAAPILERAGFLVRVPSWWHDDRPKVRMWLDIKPIDSAASPTAANMRLDTLVAFDWRVAVGDEDLAPSELEHLASAKRPLVQVRNRWVEVQPSDVASAMSFLERSRGGRMTVFEALRQCFLADDLETGLAVGGLRSSGWIENLLNAASAHEQIERLPPPDDFRGTLRHYQQRGLDWLSFLTRLGVGACLADDMGLGKTIQMIAVWLHERHGGPSPGPTLLIVPMSLVGNWQREIERFAPSLKVLVHHGMERSTGQEFVDRVAEHDVIISTYGLAHRDLEHLAAVEWHRITLDEAQNIKNPAAKQSVAIRSLRAVHRVGLTGTPIENRLSELWCIMDFLNPGYLGTAGEFRRRFAVPIERNHDMDRAQRLRHLIRPFVLRRVKSDPGVQVDLPEKMEMKVYCNLTREQAALYEALVGDMLGQIEQTGGIQRRGLVLAVLVKLKQVCNHPAHFLADGSSLPQRSGKCERIVEMIEEVLAEGERALVFTQFRQMGDLLYKLLHDSFKREVLFLHGGTTRKRRDAIVSQFQEGNGDAPILILSLKAGGFGLNLTAANHVFHFDRWWNPAVEDQATDRVYRIGQDKRVQVHKFICVGTLEEKIDALLDQKRDLADNIVGTGEEWLTELSTDKLREILTLSRDAVAED
ncbi:MAG: DEAD/DEAH box helicase [Phycisphaerae bacterium]|jgi:hypothetical protein